MTTAESPNGVTELASAVRRAGTAPWPTAATAARPLTDAEVFGPDDELGNSERAQQLLDRAAEPRTREEAMAFLEDAKARAVVSGALPDDFQFNNPTHIVEAQDEPTPDTTQVATDNAATGSDNAATGSDNDEPAPWPHQTIEFAGQKLEVRKPDAQAMVAFTLVNGKGADPVVQMRVFSMFIRKHLSPDAFEDVIGRMMDPDDDEVSLEELMKALVTMDDGVE